MGFKLSQSKATLLGTIKCIYMVLNTIHDQHDTANSELR